MVIAVLIRPKMHKIKVHIRDITGITIIQLTLLFIVGSNFHNSLNHKIYLFFHKKKHRIQRSLGWSDYFIEYHQSIVKKL